MSRQFGALSSRSVFSIRYSARSIGIFKEIGRLERHAGLLFALAFAFSQCTKAQAPVPQTVFPPNISVQSPFTIMPDGSQSSVLALNQPIGMPVYFTGDYCDPNNVCKDLQGSGGWKYLPAAFHVDAPGASQTNVAVSGIDQCGIGTGQGLWAGFGAGPSNQVAELGGVTPFFGFYAWYSTPGTKTWLITAYRCTSAGGSETTDVLAKKLVTFTIGAALFDPVPDDLNSGSATITSNLDTLVSTSRAVQGVSADGTSLALLKIPAVNVGDAITVTLLNDRNGASTSSDEDGALGLPGAATYSGNSAFVVAANTTGQGPYAFVIYRAPTDFARFSGVSPGAYRSGTCGAASGTDDQLACRTVSLQIQTQTVNGQTGSVTLSVSIVRPPVVLIHGLWSDSIATWGNFTPLYSAFGVANLIFHVELADYSGPLREQNQINATDPADVINKTIRGSSMGYAYNADRILGALRGHIGSFKKGNNPISAPVSAIQADIVAHSMGGDISRTLPLRSGYLDRNTYYQGFIHKLITVDTPHLGSFIATELLNPQNSCVRNLLGDQNLSINSVTLRDGTRIFGAVGDLSGDGTGLVMSQALTNIFNPGPKPIRTALIVGEANAINYAGLNCTFCHAFVIRNYCGSSPLGQSFTPQAWPTLFPQNLSDAIVSEISQANNLSVPAEYVFIGDIHSPGMEELSFTGPTVLDIDPTTHTAPVAVKVIKLLNTPLTQAPFNSLNP